MATRGLKGGYPWASRHARCYTWVCGAGAVTLRAQPIPEDRVRRRPVVGTVELRPQLADRAVSLGDDLVGMDRLEVDLARKDEVAPASSKDL